MMRSKADVIRGLALAILCSLAMSAKAQTFNATASGISIGAPTELEPLAMNAELSATTVNPGGVVAVAIGIRLLTGWHIYAHVPASEPYIQTQWLLDLPKGLTPVGQWIGPPSSPDPHNPELKLYRGGSDTLTFMRELRVGDDAAGTLTVRAGLMYQACYYSHCLLPTQKTGELKLTVVPKK